MTAFRNPTLAAKGSDKTNGGNMVSGTTTARRHGSQRLQTKYTIIAHATVAITESWVEGRLTVIMTCGTEGKPSGTFQTPQVAGERVHDPFIHLMTAV